MRDGALKFIRNNIERHDNVAALSSFGKDSMVLLHLIKQVEPNLPVIWIRTPFLPDETLELARRVTEEWNLNLKTVENEDAKNPEWLENVILKPDLPNTNSELCCSLLKVKPAMGAVREFDLDAWISGLRATESEERSYFTKEFKQGEFTKLHPILNWTEDDVWGYIEEHDLPTHPWYFKNYRSIGCEPCSSPSKEGESERDGRYRGTRMCGGSCGLHKIPPR